MPLGLIKLMKVIPKMFTSMCNKVENRSGKEAFLPKNRVLLELPELQVLHFSSRKLKIGITTFLKNVKKVQKHRSEPVNGTMTCFI